MTKVTLKPEATVLQAIGQLAAKLPQLPLLVKYFDDFDNEVRSISLKTLANKVDIRLDGRTTAIGFEAYGPATPVMRHFLVDSLSRHDPHTTTGHFSHIQSYIVEHGIESFLYLISASPFDARSYWNANILGQVTAAQSWSLRALLHTLCRLNIGQWSTSAASIIRGLKGPKVDHYRVVRAGECFLPLEHQALLVNYIDSTCVALVADPASLGNEELRDVCILVMSYQYAFRAGQIARIDIADVRIFSTGAVHISVQLIKQRESRKRIHINRRVKREWAPLFVELVRRRESEALRTEDGAPPRLLFGLLPTAVSRAITALTVELTGESWSSTDLRHTAAQRLADGGISHIGLTDFLGHTSDRVANVYFDTSPAQAQRVNEALAISPIYSNLAEIAKTKTIDKAMLLRLPPDQQIGAVPHGVPIAGIGGCSLGQSLCVKNPVLACYTCSRFMPLGEPEIHEQVLVSLRPIVTEFASASRNNQHSPAFGQLKGTLDAVRRVLESLRGTSTEEAQS